MRIAQDRLQGIARAIVDDLVRADAIVLGTSHEAATTAVLAELEAYFKAEATLERDAERMADQHLKAAGRDGVGLDLPDPGLRPISGEAAALWTAALAGQVRRGRILVITNDVGQVLFVTVR